MSSHLANAFTPLANSSSIMWYICRVRFASAGSCINLRSGTAYTLAPFRECALQGTFALRLSVGVLPRPIADDSQPHQ